MGTVPAQITLLSEVPATGYATRAVVYPPLVLRVTDEGGLPVPGVELGFSGDAYVEPTHVVTDDAGKAVVTWTLGPEDGINRLIVLLPDFPTVPQLTITTTALLRPLTGLWLRPTGAILQIGSSFDVRTMVEQDEWTVELDLPFIWASSDPSVARVSASGLISALSPGIATITATRPERFDGGFGFSAPTLVVVPFPVGPNGPGLPLFTMAVGRIDEPGVTIFRSDGTTETRIASCGDQCRLRAGATWSRDGRKLAMVGERDTLVVLFVVNRDGTDLHEVASVPRILVWRGTGRAETLERVYPPIYSQWSADGRLAYVRVTRNGISIETVGADGSGRATVMTNTDRVLRFEDFDKLTLPQWGLDDSMITALAGDQLYAANADGTNLRALTPPGTPGIRSYKWSPDGKTIAFRRFTPLGGSDAIVVLDPQSLSLREIAIPWGTAQLFCWDPTSSAFSFAHRRFSLHEDFSSIYTVNVDGSGLRKVVTAINSSESAGLWTPDRGFLLHLDNRWYSGGPPNAVYAQSLASGTNTHLLDLQNVNGLPIAEARGC